MHINVRKGKTKDLADVYDLVRELAAYEKSLDQVKVSLEDYHVGFREGQFAVLVAEVSSQIAGLALYYETWSTWRGKMLYLEDLVVKESFRGMGIGRQLLEAFIKDARERNCRMVKWQVLDWNEPAIRFYENFGAIIERDWWNVKIIF